MGFTKMRKTSCWFLLPPCPGRRGDVGVGRRGAKEKKNDVEVLYWSPPSLCTHTLVQSHRCNQRTDLVLWDLDKATKCQGDTSRLLHVPAPAARVKHVRRVWVQKFTGGIRDSMAISLAVLGD